MEFLLENNKQVCPFIRDLRVLTLTVFLSVRFHTAYVLDPSSGNRYLKVRVDRVGTIHNDLLTQWRHIPMGQFCANILLIRITSNYLWASEVFKNLSFKSQFFSSSQRKKISQIDIMD